MSNNLLLPDELTIQTVSAEIIKLRESSAKLTSAVTLDASGLVSVDTAGVQLLFALVKELKSKGCSVAWQSVPTVLSDTAKILGAGAALELK